MAVVWQIVKSFSEVTLYIFHYKEDKYYAVKKQHYRLRLKFHAYQAYC